MTRREFTASTKLEIIRRATDADGVIRCEECHGEANGGEVHHLEQDALQIDKTAKLTAADGALLCRACHKEITKAQAPVLAKVKRVERKHVGAKAARGSIPKPTSENDRRRVESVTVAVGVSEISRRFGM